MAHIGPAGRAELPTVQYTMLTQKLGSEDNECVIIREKNGSLIGSIPYLFLMGDGQNRIDTLDYITYVTRLLVEAPAGSRLVRDGSDVADHETITSGTYTLTWKGDAICKQLAGPVGKGFGLRPFFEDNASSVSGSSRTRSSYRQSKFREKVFLRDGHCLVSDENDDELLVACHVVPLSLGTEMLDYITHSGIPIGLYDVRNGLTLTRTLHGAYDTYMLGIFVQGDTYIVHDFSGSRSIRPFHGKVIRFRDRSKKPRRELLRWHYQQCLMTRIRGYLVRFQHLADLPEQ